MFNLISFLIKISLIGTFLLFAVYGFAYFVQDQELMMKLDGYVDGVLEIFGTSKSELLYRLEDIFNRF